MKRVWLSLAACLVSQVGHAVNFEKTTLKLGKVTQKIEVADNDDRREQGLMGRKTLSDDEGMIFLFDEPQLQAFWMKNTLVALSIGFFDRSGKLQEVIDMQPASVMDLNPKVYHSKKAAKFALEEPLGWFTRQKISLGSKLSLPDLKLP